MGQSTNGILAFGWDLRSLEDASEDHWAWALLRRLIHDVPEYGEYEDVLDQMYGLTTSGLPYGRKLELRRDVPVELVLHCSCDYPMLLLTLKTANWTAYRGSPEDLTDRLASFPGHVATEQLLEFTERADIQPPEPPHWLLASLWC